MEGSFVPLPAADLVEWIRSYRAPATSRTAFINITCASGLLDPKLAAPNLTASASWTIVATAFWAADASCSWVDAAPTRRETRSYTIEPRCEEL